MKISRLQFIILVMLAILILARISLPVFQHTSPMAAQTVQLAHLKQLGNGLQLHAADHDDKYPEKLSELSEKELPKEARQFRNPETQVLQDWLYFPGYSIHDPSETILAASPMWVRKDHQYRVITLIDGSASIIQEDDFQQRMKTQNPKKK